MSCTPVTEVILNHLDKMTQGTLLLAGSLPIPFPMQWNTLDIRVHTNQYHHWKLLHAALGNRVQFGVLADAAFIATCHTLVYFWPKSRKEAEFQLYHLLSRLPLHTELFIVGENRSGVRSAKNILTGITSLTKIDSARRCSLFYGRVEIQPEFTINSWWSQYQVGDVLVKTLPGVFSYDALDTGSQLLLSSFTEPIAGKVLDIGCGAGVLASVLAKKSPAIALTLSDVHAGALAAAQATLDINQLTATVLASDVYSDISGHFDFIISNPPFHDNLRTSLHTTERLIRDAATYLQPGGKLRIVANAFLPYPALLTAALGHYEVLAQTGRFKVFQATLSPQKTTTRRQQRQFP